MAGTPAIAASGVPLINPDGTPMLCKDGGGCCGSQIRTCDDFRKLIFPTNASITINYSPIANLNCLDPPGDDFCNQAGGTFFLSRGGPVGGGTGVGWSLIIPPSDWVACSSFRFASSPVVLRIDCLPPNPAFENGLISISAQRQGLSASQTRLGLPVESIPLSGVLPGIINPVFLCGGTTSYQIG